MRQILPLFLFFFTASIFAQTIGVVKGIVLDQSGEPLDNVRVHLLNTSFTARSNVSGEFAFYQVPYGHYIVNVRKPGFATLLKDVVIDKDTETIEVTLESEMKHLPNITVTAQKREETIQEIPLSITSLSYQAIKESQIQNVNDLTAIAPNLYASDPGDRRTITSIRGIVTTSYDPAIAVYIDGVSQFNLDTYITQLFDVERIEVLRGPQGTLYGRNAMGGVINIITRRPDVERSVFAKGTLGNYGRKRLLAGFRTPIGEKFFVGAAALYEERDGFYINEFTGSGYDDQQNLSGNFYLQYNINPSWNATFNFKHFSAENRGAFPLNMGIDAAFEDPYTLNQNQISTMKDNTFNTSLVLDHRGPNLNFSSQTAYQQNYRFYEDPIDADFSPLDALSIFNNYGSDWNRVRVLTQEFRLTSSPGPAKSFEWTAGSFLFYQENPVRQAIRFGEDAAFLGMEQHNFSLISTSESIAKGAAVFGQINFSMTEKLDLIAGLRYDYETTEMTVLGEYQGFEDPEPIYEFQPEITAKANYGALSPKLALSYSISDGNIAFASYSKGFRAGGLTPLSSDPSQPPLYEFEPEYSSNYELGSKNSFLGGKLFLNATLFFMEVTDVQVPTLILPEAITVTRNTGKLSSKGLEIEIKAVLVPMLALSYDFGYTDAAYESLRIASEGGEQNLEGKKQIFTPETTSMLALQYMPNFAPDRLGFFARGEWKYLGRQYFDLANTLVQDSYSIFNGHLGLSYKNWEGTFWARNIFDTRYISYGYDFGAVHLGSPFTYGLSLSVNF